MPLILVAPGQRVKIQQGKAYPNRFFLVRGELDGREYEVSTKTRDPGAAATFKARFELDILQRRVPGAGEPVTLAKAAELYAAFKQPSKSDQTRIDRLVARLGKILVGDVQHADLVAAAQEIYPGRKAETWNRAVIKPAAAILHYAARNKWCAWLRIEKFEEDAPRTRAAGDDVEGRLLAAIEAELATARTPFMQRRARRKRLMVLWLFHHFNRISEPLKLTWEEHIDLQSRTYLFFVSKRRVWKTKPLADEVWDVLANWPEQERTGYLFPWRDRTAVYQWLTPLCKSLGVTFTPHMARHFGGKRLNAQGEGLKTIMSALDHLDPQSSIRYQEADLDLVRTALNKRPEQGKEQGKAAAKAQKAS